MADSWNAENLQDILVPLMILERNINQATRTKPTAVMLPVSLVVPGATFMGLPLVAGDRAALIYEPPQPRRTD